jgi:hypothetical protein
MCNASKPERGVGAEDGAKSDGVASESAGWIIGAFAASAAVTSGDQENCVRIGDVTSEGHMSSNRFEVPINLSRPDQLTYEKGVARGIHTINRRSALNAL